MSALRDEKGRFIKGHTKPPEMLKKVLEGSPFPKGHTPWNKGIPWDEEMKQRISKTNKAKGIEPKIKYKARGEENWAWKGGVYRVERHTAMGRIEYIDWRKGVYERDKHTCQKTGDNTGGNLRAHHIYNYHIHPELRINLHNGICLCDKAHREFHKLYGNKDNNLTQIEEFLGRQLPEEQRNFLLAYGNLNLVS
jgi:hypothetical protein